MTLSSARADGPPPFRPPWQWHGYTLLVLFAGLFLLAAPPVAAFFRLVTEVLAAMAAVPLRLAGFDIVRNGIELRDSLSGHAVAVSAACDGSGLLVSFLAMVVWLGRRTSTLPRPIIAFVVAFAAIMAFNFARVLLLFLSIGTPKLLLAQHLFAAPLLSVLLVAWLAFHARGLQPDAVVRNVGLWLGLGFAAALVWYFVTDLVSCAVSVPLANAVLWLVPFGVSESISCWSAEPQLLTVAVQSVQPTTFVTAPFHPTDFTLATPLVAATLAMWRRPSALVRGALVSLLLFSVAMGLGALTAGYDQVAAAKAHVLSSGGIVEAYWPPSGYWLATLKAAQNMLVHFNLFVLPFAIAAVPSRPDPAFVRKPPTAPAGRRRR